MNSTIQANIKKQLHAKNMTAAELERRTGIPHAVINILHGRSKNPSIRTAQAIAKELGCTVEDLIGDNHVHDTNAKNHRDTNWNHGLYSEICTTLLTKIKNAQLNPQPIAVANCITEAYLYCLGSPGQKLDIRFIDWLLNKNLIPK